jgi:hypothetical protein
VVFGNSILPKVRGVFVVYAEKSQINQGFRSFLDLGKLSIELLAPDLITGRSRFSLEREDLPIPIF